MIVILPSPYDKYVFCDETQTLYSIKTKKVNKITSYISQTTKKLFWNVVTDRYNTQPLHIDEILKFIEQGVCEPYNDNSSEKRFIAIIEKDSIQKILVNSSNELLNKEVLTYIKNGYTASLYEKLGDYKYVPESVEII